MEPDQVGEQCDPTRSELPHLCLLIVLFLTIDKWSLLRTEACWSCCLKQTTSLSLCVIASRESPRRSLAEQAQVCLQKQQFQARWQGADLTQEHIKLIISMQALNTRDRHTSGKRKMHTRYCNENGPMKSPRRACPRPSSTTELCASS